MRWKFGWGALLLTVAAGFAQAAGPSSSIDTIKAVGPLGEGNLQAGKALRELSQLDAAALPTILAAFSDANPLALNYLRNAVDTIADRAVKSNEPLPAKELEQFIRDTKHDPRARRLAYEWLAKVDDNAAERIIPDLLHDPSSEFRRDAVARLIAEADKQLKAEQKEDATKTFQTALTGAVDDDQIKAIVGPLKELGVEVDLQKHFGFLTEWQVIGPFENRKMVGFEAVYPPEAELDPTKSYAGQLGEVSWRPLATEDEYGMVDIGKDIENYKGSAMYAVAEFNCSDPRDLEVRLGTQNAWKLWLNGEYVFGREEYHRGSALDQYRLPVSMKPGKNVILLKILQNEQKEDWAQDYRFQLRVCDKTGSAVLSESSEQATLGESTKN